jgi:hypothetical protein
VSPASEADSMRFSGVISFLGGSCGSVSATSSSTASNLTCHLREEGVGNMMRGLGFRGGNAHVPEHFEGVSLLAMCRFKSLSPFDGACVIDAYLQGERLKCLDIKGPNPNSPQSCASSLLAAPFSTQTYAACATRQQTHSEESPCHWRPLPAWSGSIPLLR